ncbi:DUF4097 family beta strand repeat-containing protein [Paenibacillus bovis]|uniref:DUF4097 domain-containing protein n=1 Tax=Paenibacillus bovis TaxID=1616788 RepID=A0A172ZJQ1_9BACL|nr:DUF4097 family beta strand repeat-containing protein [Paenibacillus bovis]ANF97769.1 hypothetical protein AR543_18290 [Paenibacillus bovis]
MKRSLSTGIAIIIVGVCVIGYWSYTHFNQQSTVHEQKSMPSTSIHSLNIRTSATDIELLPGEQDQITATLDGNMHTDSKENYSFTMIPEQGVMNVQVETQNNMFGIQLDPIDNLTLKIKIPSKTWDQITVMTSSGQMKLHDLAANRITTQSSSGDQQISGLQVAGTAIIQTSSGDITAEHNEAADSKWETTSGTIHSLQLSGQRTQITTSSGEIDYTEKQPVSDVELTTSSGDVNAKSAATSNSLQLQFTSSSGTANIQIPGMTFQEKSEHRITGMRGTGKLLQHIKVNTSSGDMKISQL